MSEIGEKCKGGGSKASNRSWAGLLRSFSSGDRSSLRHTPQANKQKATFRCAAASVPPIPEPGSLPVIDQLHLPSLSFIPIMSLLSWQRRRRNNEKGTASWSWPTKMLRHRLHPSPSIPRGLNRDGDYSERKMMGNGDSMLILL